MFTRLALAVLLASSLAACSASPEPTGSTSSDMITRHPWWPPIVFNPYASYEFQILWHGSNVAGATQASVSLGADGAIVISRGVTQDSGFVAWATGGQPDPEGLTLQVANEVGTVVASYSVQPSQVTEAQLLPNLDASAYAVDIEVLRIQGAVQQR